MSKSPNAEIFAMAAGGAALLLGVAYGLTSRDYGGERITALEERLELQSAKATEQADLLRSLTEARDQAEAQAATAKENADRALQQVAELRAQIESGDAGSGVAVAQSARDAAPLGIGRPAHAEEVAAWDVDVLPDGRGLPKGSGDVWTGEEVFAEKCASCHGDFAEGRDAWPVLAGGFDTLADVDPVKTVGSYWPYLSTVWDYVHRSMPFGNAGTLSDDEVYAITAYILYSNDLVDDEFTLSDQTFADVAMYNTAGFVVDDRPDVEYPLWRAEPCMENCLKSPAEITRRSTDVGVTPADDGSMAESAMEQQLAALGGTEWGKERVAGSVFMGPGGVMQEEPATAEIADTASPLPSDALDPTLVARGKAAFNKCAACHQVGNGAKNRSGPQLNGVMGRSIGGLDGFRYSKVFKSAHENGQTWDHDALSSFLSDPRGYLNGTKMSFRGFDDPADIAAVIAYLKTFE